MNALPRSASLVVRAGQHTWPFSIGPMQVSTLSMMCEFQQRTYGSEPAEAMVVVTLLPWSHPPGKLTSFNL